MKTCCVTGHRAIPVDEIERVKSELRKVIMSAIEDGYTHFVSGFAETVDLYFAEIVAELKMNNKEISLEAAIPYRKRLKAKNILFQKLISECNKVTVYCEEYRLDCFMQRNKGMVNQSNRVIAVYDGRVKGGTAGTIGYAKKMNRELRIIEVRGSKT